MIEGIADLRDESDRDGMRIVIELRRGEVPEVLLNNLYKHTALQTSFGIITLAIADGRPRELPLLDLIDRFIEFRRDVVRRRTEHDLRKAEARAHILEGLKTALDHLDAVISLIRASKTPAAARLGLVANFPLSGIQAQAILDMQLQRLTGLERQKVLDELADLHRTIERLRAILESDVLLLEIVVDELRKVRESYGDERRTEIIEAEGDFSIEDLIADEDVAITVSNTGYIKRTALTQYRNQRRGGKGRIGMRTRDEDFLTHVFIASTHAYILIFTTRGRMYWLKVHRIPDVGPAGRGKAIANLVSLRPDEKIAALETVRELPAESGRRFVVMGTRQGVVKRVDLQAFRHPRTDGIIAMRVRDEDVVVGARADQRRRRDLHRHPSGEGDPVSRERPADNGPDRGRRACIRLRPSDQVVAMTVARPGGTMLSVTEHGFGKRTALDEYRVQSRGGLGIISIHPSPRNGRVVGVAYVEDDDELMLVTQQGQDHSDGRQ